MINWVVGQCSLLRQTGIHSETGVFFSEGIPVLSLYKVIESSKDFHPADEAMSSCRICDYPFYGDHIRMNDNNPSIYLGNNDIRFLFCEKIV
jgi:hypothetical protein